jgi:glycosyltransferase involved in cell wall biosynthesis
MTARRSMAVVRAHRPNLAELAMYRPLLDDFDVTLFYTGLTPEECRRELDALGLERMGLFRYRSHGDLLPSAALGRVLDYKLGFGSVMLSGLRAALAHDVINVVDPVYRFPAQLAARVRPGQRLVVVRWEVIPNRYDDVWGGRQRSARTLARADGIVCTSHAARQSLALRAPAAPRVATIHPGIVLPDVAPPPSGDPRIVTVARLQWQKGLDDLIAAVALLRREHGVTAGLTIVGGGDPRPWRRLARSYGVDALVELAGTVPNAVARERIAGAAVYCQPSAVSRTWCEQFGYAVVEAMACGRPVVASSSGVLPEIVGPDGVYAATRNAARLARALADVLGDREGAERRGRALAAFARARYDAERQGAALREFLHAL